VARYSRTRIRQLLLRGDGANTTTQKGRILEELIGYIFERVPGIPIVERNQMNEFQTEEIDVAFWNDKSARGFHFLPYTILVECKNWSNAVGSIEVAYFIKKLENKGLDFGILVATNGITGSNTDFTRANFEVSIALAKGVRLIVITRGEIERLGTTQELIQLVKKKLCKLALLSAASTDD